MKNIAFLGLGVMGKYMASNLVHSNKFRKVKVWNRSKSSPGYEFATSKGAHGFEFVSEAIEECTVICICVSNAEAVRQILFGKNGIAPLLEKNSTIINFSTIGPKATLSIHQRLLKKGINFIDAPVSGGDIGAKNATLTLMIGSTKKESQDFDDIFKAVGKNIYYINKVSYGERVKCINQLLCAIHMLALCEGFALADAIGVSKEIIVDICSTGAAGSWALKHLGSEIAKDNYAPGFMIKHMLKDLALVYENVPQGVSLNALKLAGDQFKKISSFKDLDGTVLGTQAMFLNYKKPDAKFLITTPNTL